MFWAEQTAVLERVAAGHPLPAILHDIVVLIERQAEGMLCSILLLNEDGKTVRTGAAPNLPARYVQCLDGLQIGPTAGSCGAAAYLKASVIVEDIATHPNWQPYRQLALPFGLRACWSSPILSPNHEVLGTFAMYYQVSRAPSSAEVGWVAAATHLAAIAIVSDAATKALRDSEARSRQLARLYAMSSTVNEVIIHERSPALLYQSACRIAVDHGLARLAWIGRIDADTRRLVPIAHAGVGLAEMSSFNQELAGDPSTARAIHEGVPALYNDIDSTPDLSWRDIAAACGVRSCAVIPMRQATTTGLLVMCSDRINGFGEEETKVLVTLAEDIEFAVNSAQTEVALRHSEERLRTLIEWTPDVAIQWYDESGRIIFYNQASRRLFGWGDQGVLGRSLLELGFWNAAEEDRFREARAAAAAGRHVSPTEFHFRRPDGCDGFLLSTVFRIPLSDSEHCTVCMDVDLTEHRKMEAAVRAGEALRSSIYDSVTDVIFYLRVDGDQRYRFASVNRAFLLATGLRDDQIVGRLIDDVIPAPSLGLVKAKYAEAVATRQRVSWEEVSRYPSGTKYGDVAVTPLYDTLGRCTHLVGTVHDVTERRAAEQERRQIEEQLHQAQRLHALGTLAGGIAHDFNNILAAVHGNLDVALDQIDPRHAAHECLTEVKQAARRATALVRQILTFGRKSEPRREPVDLAAVLDEALKLSRVTLNRSTKLELSIARDLPRILGDSTQVHQAVVNLVTNAAQAIGDAAGVIEVRAERCFVTPGARPDAPEAEGVYARLSVRDDGPGMDRETLRRAFEPFFTTKAPGKGTGLGLSVVHGVMKLHQGMVSVQSEPGRGTTFELLFPAAPEPAAVETPPPVQATGRQRILFVDDDEALVVLAQRAFSRLGHRISAFSNSLEALETFRNRPDDFDVVVTDNNMPELDGPGLIAELRRIRPDVPVILTSGYVHTEDAAVAAKLGPTRLVEKPQSLDDLAKLVSLPG